MLCLTIILNRMKRDGRTVTKVLIRDIAFTRGENWPGFTFTVVSLTLKTALQTAWSLFFLHASFKKRKINLLIRLKQISYLNVTSPLLLLLLFCVFFRKQYVFSQYGAPVQFLKQSYDWTGSWFHSGLFSLPFSGDRDFRVVFLFGFSSASLPRRSS